ncbi:serine--tRNA ligase [Amycolatopsis acidiphila]|uniref:Serine--tRNA ligase n=1 Tax=Amycolatopsis acidiphila TaxID=715473 RepID=A0A558AMN5_9PSEU|nr:serine--tRNA ligase [Amycolatopsis acidiphila]TVT25527.1 serine--tRNA ligase [Amycolatopsis acidiphila]UIJ60272.1 serine--tRNA ligase [Amycolatopsis acidiphila]GHG60370.1 serine--tRNA ligase [Amycolatopsis acidiphila]
MHDPRQLLDPETDAAAKLRRRGYVLDTDRLSKLMSRRSEVIGEGDQARAQSKKSAAEVQAAARAGDDITELREQARRLKVRIGELEEEQRAVEAELNEFLLAIPNIPLDELPDGATEEYAEEVRQWGSVPEFDFEPLDHVDLGERAGFLDLQRATKLSGPRFAVFKGPGAKLERALAAFFLDVHIAQGYTEFSLPALVTRQTMTGTGQLPKFEEDLFRTAVADRELFLIPTAEVPLVNLHAGEILNLGDLPLRYTAHTPCFRSEAGSYGRDTRGLIRQHEFSKVELVQLVDAESSRDALEEILVHAEEVLQKLGLAYRVIKLPAGDIGFSAQITYDIEVWLPSQQTYREISSASDTGVFQTRRAGIRGKAKDGKRGAVAALNASGLPVGRTLVALVEQYQQADGAIRIPDALVPYTGFAVINADGSTS